MTRLRRVYETAEETGGSVEEIGIERFGNIEAFQAALDERRILDERDGQRDRDRGRRGRDHDGERRFMFNDIGSAASSRSSSFRRPGAVTRSTPSTPSPPTGAAPVNRRLDSLRLPSQAASPLQHSHTPIPSVMTPPRASGFKATRSLSPSSLNKLQAKVLRAKLMGAPDAEELEREYETAAGISDGGPKGQKVLTKVELLPTLDGQGRLYDVGHGREDDRALAGNRKKKEKVNTICECFIQPILCRSRHETLKLGKLSDTMPTTTILPSVNCCGRNDLVGAWLTKRISTLNSLEPSWEMANLR